MDLSINLDGAREIAPGISNLAGDNSNLVADNHGSFAEGFLCGREAERRRLTQELHDTTSQLLIGLRLSTARLHTRASIDDAAESIREIEDLARQIEEQIRILSFLNFPVEIHDGGLALAIERLARGFGSKTGLAVSFENRGSIDGGNGPAAIALLRIVQEALANTYRHARATSVRISLVLQRGYVKLKIADDGQGLPAVPCNGVGLEGMRQRMAAEGGTLSLRRLRRGTLVTATVPLVMLQDSMRTA